MNKVKKVHRAGLTPAELKQLRDDFPEQAQIVEGLGYFAGSRFVVHLADLTPPIKQQLGADVVDRLYGKAYRLKEANFFSYYYQVNEVLRLPKSRVSDILEIGIGIGIFQSLINIFDYNLVTFDLIPEREPDCLGDVRTLPLKSKSFDLVCAFEVLEHLPYQYFKPSIQEMVRTARHYLYISLPYPANSIYLRFRPHFVQRFFRRFSLDIDMLRILPTKRLADKDEAQLLQRKDKHNPHYWEVNRRSFPKKKVLSELSSCGLKVLKEFHNPVHPYHYFILCEIVA